MSDLQIRAAGDGDYGAIASVLERIDPEHRRSANELRARDRAARAAGLVSERLIAILGAEPVGYGVYGELDWCADPEVWSVGVHVVPERRRRSIGTAIHARIVAAAEAAGVTRLFGQSAEGDGSGPAFAAALGYQLVGTDFESWIDLDDSDPAAEGADGPVPAASGVAITTLAEARRTFPDWFERLYGLYSAIEADVPSPFPIRPVPVASFRRRHVEGPSVIPEAFFVALVDDEWVGLTELQRIELHPTWLQQELTGVVRPHRRRGIAMLLKRTGVAWARARGFERIRTSNNSRNIAMLAVNDRLGYRRGNPVGLWLRDR